MRIDERMDAERRRRVGGLTPSERAAMIREPLHFIDRFLVFDGKVDVKTVLAIVAGLPALGTLFVSVAPFLEGRFSWAWLMAGGLASVVIGVGAITAYRNDSRLAQRAFLPILVQSLRPLAPSLNELKGYYLH
jgi:hypothetical protein